jgi:hypothetical protein
MAERVLVEALGGGGVSAAGSAGLRRRAHWSEALKHDDGPDAVGRLVWGDCVF